MNPWLLAARPKTLFASAGPVLLGTAIAFYTTKSLSVLAFITTLLCAVLMQVMSNLVNDYYDGIRGLDDEKRLGPTRVTSTGLLTPEKVKKGFLLVAIVAFILGLYLMYIGGLPIIIIGLLSLFFAWAYTGGPFPLSHYALGEVAAFTFFGPVAVWGTTFLQTGGSSELALIAGSGVGLISATIMAINNLRDRKSDSEKGKITVATLLSEKGARAFTLILCLLSTFIPFLVMNETQSPYVLVALIPFYLMGKTWIHVARAPIDERMNLMLANTGKYLFLYSVALGIGLYFS